VKTCPTCGKQTEEPRDVLRRNVFVSTGTALVVWAAALSVAQWTWSWWAARPHVGVVMATLVLVTGHYWWRLLRTARRAR
jgi:hypothetical protein